MVMTKALVLMEVVGSNEAEFRRQFKEPSWGRGE